MPSRRRIGRLTRAGLVLLFAYAVFLLWWNTGSGPLRESPLRLSAGVHTVDEHLELARRYAPFVYHEFHPDLGRQDVPAPVDFDGNLRGDDNWEAFTRFELLPTLYYALLETETHYFLTYHLFHPRDWTRFDPGLHLTHENDGENLQVVVQKSTGAVVLLFTQAHYRGGAYANEGSGFLDGASELRGPFLLVDDSGAPALDGPHAGVFVEAGGHGIYGVTDRRSRVTVGPGGEATFERAGWVLAPRGTNEVVREPPLEPGLRVPYRLESTTAKLWPLLASGELVGAGALLDGSLPFECERLRIDVPRYYEGDRFSGPLGPDRGISPFAVDFRFGRGEVGALFFEPARRYAECLGVPADWSLVYRNDPFR